MNSHTAPVCGPLPGLKLICPFVIQQEINNFKGWPSINYACLTFFPFSLWQEAISQSAVKLKSTAPYTKTIRYDMLMYLTLTRSSFSLLCGIRTSWDVTTFIHSTSAGGLEGPSAGADRWISQPKGSEKRQEREEHCLPSFSILHDFHICLSTSHGLANVQLRQSAAVTMMTLLRIQRTVLQYVWEIFHQSVLTPWSRYTVWREWLEYQTMVITSLSTTLTQTSIILPLNAKHRTGCCLIHWFTLLEDHMLSTPVWSTSQVLKKSFIHL